MSTRATAECDCGWTGGPYRSPAQADYALSRHSCAKQRRKDAARLRQVRRRSKIDRTPKPCLHKQADHQHGTYACYVLDACRCRPCAKANREYERNRIRQQAYGRWDGLVPASHARAHVLHLMAQGMGLKRIVAVSGVSSGTLTKLLYGVTRPDGTRRPPAARITPATRDKILAVRPDLADGALIPATGTARRVQALVHQGWSVQKIADHAGIDRQAVDHSLRGDTIRMATARAVAAAYDALWDQAPPEDDQRSRIAASRARRRAQAAGWVGPLAWDDDTIDDPAATPDTGTTSGNSGASTYEVEDVEHLLDGDDWTWGGLAARLGTTRWSLRRRLTRAGRDDLATLLDHLTSERGAA